MRVSETMAKSWVSVALTTLILQITLARAQLCNSDQSNFFGLLSATYDQPESTNRCAHSIELRGDKFSQYINPNQLVINGKKCQIPGTNSILVQSSESCSSAGCAGVKQIIAISGAPNFRFGMLDVSSRLICGELQLPQAYIVWGEPCENFAFSGISPKAGVPIAFILSGTKLITMCTTSSVQDMYPETSAYNVIGEYGNVASSPAGACLPSVKIKALDVQLQSRFKSAIFTEGSLSVSALSACNAPNTPIEMFSNGRLYQAAASGTMSNTQKLFLANLFQSELALEVFSAFNETSQFFNWVVTNNVWERNCLEHFRYATGSIGMVASVTSPVRIAGISLEPNNVYLFLQPPKGDPGTASMPQCVYRKSFRAIPHAPPTAAPTVSVSPPTASPTLAPQVTPPSLPPAPQPTVAPASPTPTQAALATPSQVPRATASPTPAPSKSATATATSAPPKELASASPTPQIPEAFASASPTLIAQLSPTELPQATASPGLPLSTSSETPATTSSPAPTQETQPSPQPSVALVSATPSQAAQATPSAASTATAAPSTPPVVVVPQPPIAAASPTPTPMLMPTPTRQADATASVQPDAAGPTPNGSVPTPSTAPTAAATMAPVATNEPEREDSDDEDVDGEQTEVESTGSENADGEDTDGSDEDTEETATDQPSAEESQAEETQTQDEEPSAEETESAEGSEMPQAPSVQPETETELPLSTPEVSPILGETEASESPTASLLPTPVPSADVQTTTLPFEPSPSQEAPRPTPSRPPTPPGGGAAGGSSTPLPTPEVPECVDASWISAHHAGYEVHSAPTFAEVLCFGALPCATTGHVVSRLGKLMTMAELCSIEPCTASSMQVNGVQHVRHSLMPCDRDVCLTTLDARANSNWKRFENSVVYNLLQTRVSAVAHALTQVQLRASTVR
mmetsp:Transcript_2127/g.5735  ORF Transcript_2127/g.5735 Transcript_2127/m.5735 type:complete len:919 (-) Transcript_2127:835-3591(-)